MPCACTLLGNEPPSITTTMRRINVAATEQRHQKHSMPREFDRFGNFVHDDSNASCCPKISRWCVKDTEGIIFAVLTWILLLYGYFVLIIFVLIPENYSWSRVIINWIILNSLTILAFLSHIRAMFINPGTVPLNTASAETLLEQETNGSTQHCLTCRSLKPLRTYHCRVCNRCVREMDHHCIFINNCVGENNQKYFILFTVYTCILSIYGLIVLLSHIFGCVQSNWKACPRWPSPLILIIVIITSLEAFSFCIFTGFMAGMQLFALYRDTTTVGLFNNRYRPRNERRRFISSLESVFGGPIHWHWLNPLHHPVDWLHEQHRM